MSTTTSPVARPKALPKPRAWRVPPWRWALRAAVAVALAAGLAQLPYWLFRTSGLDRYLELRERLAQVSSKNRDRRRANALLKAAAHDLEHDPRALERVARDQLGLVRPGEVLFQVETEKP